jgi:diacylglycerol kinase family enzyme
MYFPHDHAMNASTMETYLFTNPFSGHYCSARINSAIAQLKSAGISATLCSVEQPGIFQAINEATTPLCVIVAAGDGTVNAVINGLNPAAATLAILPLGTSNVLARELGIHTWEEGVERIIAGKTRPLSVAVLESAGISRRFVLMAGFGFDGAVVRDVSLGWKRILKQGAYALSAFKNSLQWDPGSIQLRSGDRSITCHSVIVCNASRYGGDFILAPESPVFSPGLTALCIQKNSRRAYLRLACDLFSGRIAKNPALLRISADEFEILGIKPVQIDGDFVGYSPARLKVLADFVRIIA